MVMRMEACGIITRWPHHLQLWKCLASKDWVPNLCIAPRYHVPLTTRVPKSLVLVDALKAARQAIAALRLLQADRQADDSYKGPAGSNWFPGLGCECCVA